jgi:hypothetical protein
MERFDDTLEIAGIGVGALLVLIGVGTLAGQPWTQTTDILVAVVRSLGALLTIGVGAGLIWLTRTETETAIPGTDDSDEADDAEAA